MERIAIGSCNKESFNQPMWPIIRKSQPDLFVWGGDNIYADTTKLKTMKSKYKKQNSVKEYKKLKKEVPIIGTWDDHDFGKNNIGKEYPLKKESQKQFLKFIGEPKGTARWDQEGVYTAYDYGEEGKKVKIIILDTRYHRDLPNLTDGRYIR